MDNKSPINTTIDEKSLTIAKELPKESKGKRKGDPWKPQFENYNERKQQLMAKIESRRRFREAVRRQRQNRMPVVATKSLDGTEVEMFLPQFCKPQPKSSCSTEEGFEDNISDVTLVPEDNQEESSKTWADLAKAEKLKSTPKNAESNDDELVFVGKTKMNSPFSGLYEFAKSNFEFLSSTNRDVKEESKTKNEFIFEESIRKESVSEEFQAILDSELERKVNALVEKKLQELQICGLANKGEQKPIPMPRSQVASGASQQVIAL